MNLRIVPNIPGIPLIKKAKSHNSSSHRAIGNPNSNQILKRPERVSLIAPHNPRDNESGGIPKPQPPINYKLNIKRVIDPNNLFAGGEKGYKWQIMPDGTDFCITTGKLWKNGKIVGEVNLKDGVMRRYDDNSPSSSDGVIDFDPNTGRVLAIGNVPIQTEVFHQTNSDQSEPSIIKSPRQQNSPRFEEVASPNPKEQLVQLANGTLFNPATNRVLRSGIRENLSPAFAPELTPTIVKPPLMDPLTAESIREELRDIGRETYAQRMVGDDPKSSSRKSAETMAKIQQGKIAKEEEYQKKLQKYEADLEEHNRKRPTLAVNDLATAEKPPEPPQRPKKIDISPLSMDEIAEEMAGKIHYIKTGEQNKSVKLYIPHNDQAATLIASQIETVLKQLENSASQINILINNLASQKVSKPVLAYPKGDLSQTAAIALSSQTETFSRLVKLNVLLALYTKEKDITLESSNISGDDLIKPNIITPKLSSEYFSTQVAWISKNVLKELRARQNFLNNNLGFVEKCFEIAAPDQDNKNILAELRGAYFSLEKLITSNLEELKSVGVIDEILPTQRNDQSSIFNEMYKAVTRMNEVGQEAPYDPMAKGSNKVVSRNPLNPNEVSILPLNQAFYNILERYSNQPESSALEVREEIGNTSEALTNIITSYKKAMKEFTELPSLGQEIMASINKILAGVGIDTPNHKVRTQLEEYIELRKGTIDYLQSVYGELNKIAEKGISQADTLTDVAKSLNQLQKQAKTYGDETLSNLAEACNVLVSSLEQKTRVIPDNDWGGDPRKPLKQNLWDFDTPSQDFLDAEFSPPRTTMQKDFPGLKEELKGAIVNLSATDIKKIIEKYTERYNDSPSAIVNQRTPLIDEYTILSLIRLSNNNPDSFIELIEKRLLPSGSQRSINRIADELAPLTESAEFNRQVQTVLPTLLKYDTRKAEVLREVSGLLSKLPRPNDRNLDLQLAEIKENVERALIRQANRTSGQIFAQASVKRLSSMAANMRDEVLQTLMKVSDDIIKVEAALDKLSERQALAEIQATQQSAFTLEKLTEITETWAAGLQGVSIKDDISVEALLQLMQSNNYLQSLEIPELQSLVQSLFPGISDKQFEKLKTGLGLMNSQPDIARTVIDSSLKDLDLDPELVENWHQNYSKALNKAEEFLGNLQALPSEEPIPELKDSSSAIKAKPAQKQGFWELLTGIKADLNQPAEPVDTNSSIKTGSLKEAAIRLTESYLDSARDLVEIVNTKFNIVPASSIPIIDEKAAEITSVEPKISEFVQSFRNQIIESMQLFGSGSKGSSEKLEQLSELSLKEIKADTLQELIATANDSNTPDKAKEAIKTLLSHADLTTLRQLRSPADPHIVSQQEVWLRTAKINELVKEVFGEMFPITLAAQNASLEMPNLPKKGISTDEAGLVINQAVSGAIIRELEPTILDLIEHQTGQVIGDFILPGGELAYDSETLPAILTSLIQTRLGNSLPDSSNKTPNLQSLASVDDQIQDPEEMLRALVPEYMGLVQQGAGDKIEDSKKIIEAISFLDSSTKEQIFSLINSVAHAGTKFAIQSLELSPTERQERLQNGPRNIQEASEEIIRQLINPSVATARHETHARIEAERQAEKKVDELKKLESRPTIMNEEEYLIKLKGQIPELDYLTGLHETEAALRSGQLTLLKELLNQAGISKNSSDPLHEPLQLLSLVSGAGEYLLSYSQPLDPGTQQAMESLAMESLATNGDARLNTMIAKNKQTREIIGQVVYTNNWEETVKTRANEVSQLSSQIDRFTNSTPTTIIVSSTESINKGSIPIKEGFITLGNQLGGKETTQTSPQIIDNINTEVRKLGHPTTFPLNTKTPAEIAEVKRTLTEYEMDPEELGVPALESGTFADITDNIPGKMGVPDILKIAALGTNSKKIEEFANWVAELTGKNPLDVAVEESITIPKAAETLLAEAQNKANDLEKSYVSRARYAKELKEEDQEEVTPNIVALKTELEKKEIVLGALTSLTEGEIGFPRDKEIHISRQSDDFVRAAAVLEGVREIDEKMAQEASCGNPFLKDSQVEEPGEIAPALEAPLKDKKDIVVVAEQQEEPVPEGA